MTLSPTKHRTLSRQPSSPLSRRRSSSSSPRIQHHVPLIAIKAEDDAQTTPKRKVINSIEPVSSAKKGKKRETLAERLAAAAAASAASGKAKVKKSHSVGEGLKESASVPMYKDSLSMQTTPQQTRSEIMPNTMPNPRMMASSTASGSSSDKVVVCVRIKPTQNPFASTAYDITPTSLSLSDEHPKVKQRGGKAGREDGYTYTFDKLLQHPATTPDLYGDKVAPLVEKAMNGFNSTIFAYGQTGSGKSFTMTGTHDELGIIPCAVDGVFDAITADTDRAFLLRVSYIEIYNETLRDLLNFKKGPLRDDEKPSIHFIKGKVYVEPLVEEIVSNPEDVMELLERGNAGRRIGATDWNERSSRSHCVFTIVIESRPRDGDGDEDIRLSRLNLIVSVKQFPRASGLLTLSQDLAGSEKAVSDSERRGEGKHINQSLLALREVINKLTEKTKASHIPYRNSKLTHLLENALGGDSNICVICTMSAEEEHCSETLETLKFAGRCSQVKTNAKKNVLPSSERALIRAKDQEIEELRQRLQGLTGQQALRADPDTDQISDLADSVAAMEVRRARLKEQLAKLNGEILTSELPRAGAGRPMSPPKPKRRRISDFSAIMAVGTNRIGLGLGTPQKVNDRRAISGMTRVPEAEEEMPGIMGTLESVAEGSFAKNFDQDRILAGLRRALAAKEEDLSLANRNLANALARASQLSQRDERIASLTAELSAAQDSLTSLQRSLEYTERDLRDQNAQLRATRIELVSTIDDKTSKIDELETKILDLRKSREELVMEGQGRIEEVQKRVDEVEREREEVKASLLEAKERLEMVEREKVEELQRLKTDSEISSAKQIQAMVSQHESSVATLNSKIQELLISQASQKEAIAAMNVYKLQVEQQRNQALSDLDRFQKEALSNETKILSELRQDIGHLRKLREDDQSTWDRQRTEFEKQLAESRSKEEDEGRLKSMEEEMERSRSALVESKGKESKLSAQISEALGTLEQAAKANANLEDRLKHEMQARVALETERDEARARLAEADGAANQLEVELVARQTAEDKVAEISRRLEDQLAGYARISTELESERDQKQDLEARLSELAQQLNERTTTQHEANILLEAERQAKKEVENRLATAHAELEGKEKRLEAEQSARRDAEARVSEIALLRDEAIAGQREVEQRSEKDTLSHLETAKRFADLERQQREVSTAEKNWKKKLEEETSARREIEERLEELVMEREVAGQGKDDAQRRLEVEIASRREIERKLASLVEQHGTCAASEVQGQQRLEEEIAARQQVEKEVSELKRQQLDEITSQNKLRKQLDNEAKLRTAVEHEFAQLRQQQDTQASKSTVSSKQLEEASAALTTAEKKLAHLTQQLGSVSADSQQLLKVEITARKRAEQSLAELSSKLADNASVKERLGIEIAARESAERHATKLSTELVAKHEAAQQVLEEELLSLRQALRVAQKHAASTQAEVDIHRSNVAKLTQEVHELRSRPETMIAAALRSRRDSSGPGLKDDEIERFEKVVEIQQRIIDEQREKIERWAKEMEKQREIVRLLTNDNTASIPSPLTNSPRPTHGKSQSLSHSPGNNGPPAKGFPSTFTARNLALPTTPSPLPMHPNQFSNAATRKGRRVTIEHDIDRLAESSKVNKAKAVFESPDKNQSTPATPPRAPLRNAQSIRSVPRQRRP
ncbi:hypothetical protein IAR55_001793 [Kwoniella newhampshirensis]|uniref:Kinesin motor domain-containing protein n=1 Tax=Kwoniella newhampshirensis TaxID=1651941 RepID=A0AAW0Z312_9TREE